MTGIAITVWSDGVSIKYRIFSSQDELEKAIENMKEHITPKMWNVFFISHDMTINTIKGNEYDP